MLHRLVVGELCLLALLLGRLRIREGLVQVVLRVLYAQDSLATVEFDVLLLVREVLQLTGGILPGGREVLLRLPCRPLRVREIPLGSGDLLGCAPVGVGDVLDGGLEGALSVGDLPGRLHASLRGPDLSVLHALLGLREWSAARPQPCALPWPPHSPRRRPARTRP